jgi:hypothetical protein
MEISVAKGTVAEKVLQLSADHELHINVERGAQLQLLLEDSCHNSSLKYMWLREQALTFAI